MNINEIIELNANEGLEIDFSKIVTNATAEVGLPSYPSWVRAHISVSEIISNVNVLSASDSEVRFTENDLETYLKKWLEYHFNCGIKSFRWTWDKYRNFNAA